MPEIGPEMIGMGAAVIVVPYLVAALKPLLRRIPLFRPYEDDDEPWLLVSVALSVAWVVALRIAGEGPGWLEGHVLIAVLAGVTLGVLASAARDFTHEVRTR